MEDNKEIKEKVSQVIKNRDMIKTIEKKVDRILGLLDPEELSTSSENTLNCNKEGYSEIEIGEASDEMMRRFNLGPYSKNKTPGSDSV